MSTTEYAYVVQVSESDSRSVMNPWQSRPDESSFSHAVTYRVSGAGPAAAGAKALELYIEQYGHLADHHTHEQKLRTALWFTVAMDTPPAAKEKP